MLQLILLLAAIPVVLVLLHWLYHLVTKPANLPPGPFPLPILGNVHLFLFREPRYIFRDLAEKYGGAVTIHLGHSIRQVFFLDNDVILNVFTGRETADFGANRPRIPGLDNCGVLFPPWPEAAEGRKYSLICFNKFGLSSSAQKLETSGRHVEDEIDRFCSYLDSIAGQPTDISERLLDSVSSCVLLPLHGRRLDLNDPRSKELYTLSMRFFDSTIGQFLLFIAIPQLSVFSKQDFISGAMQMRRIFLDWIEEEIPKRMANFDPEQTPADFIDCFIATHNSNAAQKISKESFAQMLADLFLGAVDTTSQTTLWILFYLAKFPNWQKELQDEIDSEIAQNQQPTLEHRTRLVKLQAFTNEVLRHATLVEYVNSRVTPEEFSVAIRGKMFMIPKFTAISYAIQPLHENKSYWGDPENFRPDRWLTNDEKPSLKSHSHFLPFGVGKRVCIGEQAAKTVQFLFLARMLYRFSLKLGKDLPLSAHIQRANRNPPKYELIMQPRD